MSIRSYRQLATRSAVPIAIAVGLGLATAAALSAVATPQYHSQATLYLAPTGGASATDLNQGASYAQSQVLSFAGLSTTSAILSPVIDQLGLDRGVSRLAGQLDVSAPANTSILHIGVTDPSATLAADIANATAESMRAYVNRVAPANSTRQPAIIARIAELARPAGAPSSPNLRLNLAAGGLIGLLVGVLASVARETLDTRLRTEEDLAAATSVPLLATLPVPHAAYGRGAARGAAAQERDGIGGAPEAYRQLGAAVRYALGTGEDTAEVSLVVAPVQRGADASDVTRGLAAAVQESGGSVLVLPHGGAPGASERDESVDYDLVLIEAAPVLTAADAALASQAADGTILTVRAGAVRREALNDSLELLERAGAAVVGVVLTHVPSAPYR